jgi:hypothetical protein
MRNTGRALISLGAGLFVLSCGGTDIPDLENGNRLANGDAGDATARGGAPGTSGGGGAAGSGGGSSDAGHCTCSGPAPGAPNYICADGTLGGPVCAPSTGGVCSWQFRSCPQDAEASGGGSGEAGTGVGNSEAGASEGGTSEAGSKEGGTGIVDAGQCKCAGPRPGAPNYLCSDGSTGGPFCGPSDGGCSWQFRSCPDAGGPPDASVCCPTGWSMYACDFASGGAKGFNCHNPLLKCASSSICGGGCDFVVSGWCASEAGAAD